ncbi:cytochrome P450 [Thamnocephalis sphaerospora]|uniref:Cytochrome P450 n=1 Tax=Thamnocephalis sphaerospora TaxID=78915 RepID=A0A4P9XTM0_9FUNG|nr:cytochrome P450 [Thamnocephalis sphaerospora]|eukprot:RKP09513.1 cytochrome P450 [Thamnocephalis sphaerospora]
MWHIFESLNTSVCTVLLLGGAYATYKVARMLTAPLAAVPGPWHSKITSAAYFYALLRGKTFSYLTEQHRIYGPVIRLDSVSITDANAVRTVLSTHRFRKGRLYKVAKFGGGHSKKMIAPAFSNVAMINLEPIIMDVGINKIVKVLEKKGAGGAPVDLFKTLMCMTLDVTCAVALGGSFNMLEADNHPITSWVHGILVLALTRHMFGEKPAELMLPNRREAKNAPKDVLQSLIEAVDDNTGEGLASSDIVSEIITLLLAGSDSTATALSWSIILLSDHPECMKRLVAELDEAFPSIDEPITHNKVAGLTYLNAVLHEVLRQRSPSSIDLPRVTPNGGATLGGHFIPGETEIIISPYAVTNDARNFERPLEFDPSRWLVSSEMVSEMKHIYIPFSMGARACLGQNLAWLEMRLALATILRKFTFKILPGQNLQPVLRLVLQPSDARMMVTAIRRTS